MINSKEKIQPNENEIKTLFGRFVQIFVLRYGIPPARNPEVSGGSSPDFTFQTWEDKSISKGEISRSP